MDHGLLIDRGLSGYCGKGNVSFPTTAVTPMLLVVLCCLLVPFATLLLLEPGLNRAHKHILVMHIGYIYTNNILASFQK